MQAGFGKEHGAHIHMIQQFSVVCLFGQTAARAQASPVLRVSNHCHSLLGSKTRVRMTGDQEATPIPYLTTKSRTTCLERMSSEELEEVLTILVTNLGQVLFVSTCSGDN